MIQRIGGEQLVGLIATVDWHDSEIDKTMNGENPEVTRAEMVQNRRRGFNQVFRKILTGFEAHDITVKIMSTDLKGVDLGPAELIDRTEFETKIAKALREGPNVAVVHNVFPVMGMIGMKTRAAVALKMRWIIRTTPEMPKVEVVCTDGMRFSLASGQDQKTDSPPEEVIVEEIISDLA